MNTAYWHIVLRCLTEILEITESDARRRLREYRLLLNQTPAPLRRDMVYHFEPWELAQRLAASISQSTIKLKLRQLSREQLPIYEQIIREAQTDASVLGTENEVQSFSLAS
jgi:hypothetical protein